jgi:hypothetical protein
MTKLPKTVPSAPLDYALQWLEDNKEHDFFGTGLPTLHPDAGGPFVRDHLKLRAMSGRLGMKWVIDNARAGWDEAHDALCELYADFKHYRRDPPPALEVYCTEALLEPRRRSKGRRKSKNGLQDVVFVGLIDELLRQFGIPPTRNTKAQRCDSACDVLAVAINRTKWLGRRIDYKGAEALWLRGSVFL